MRLKFLFLSFVFLLALHPVAAEAQSGACGVDVKWRLDGNTLIISGEGEMYNYDSSQTFSYAIFSDMFNKVVFEEGVTSVGNHAFSGFSNLTSVELSSTINSIGDWSFESTGLTEIDFPESVTVVGGCSFYNTSLVKVAIPSSVNIVGIYAFSLCHFLKEVYWNANISFEECHENFQSGMFDEDPIEKITFGPNAKNIYGGLMLGSAVNGYEIESSGNIEYIGNEAFEGSKWLAENIQKDILYFDKCLYRFGSGLNTPTHVIVKDGTIGISSGAFAGCKYLIGITIPESISILSNDSFGGCDYLSNVVWNAVNWNATYYVSWNIAWYVSPFGPSLSEVTFGEKVERIPTAFFAGCTGLTSLSFPESLKEIDNNAFDGCTGIKSVTAPWYDVREINVWEATFAGVTENATLYVPKGCIEEYRKTSPWNEFKYMKEIDGSAEIESVAAPTITYEDGALHFYSTTSGAEYHYSISDPDIVTDGISNGSVELSSYYEITAFASAKGYINSRTVSARLYFIEANLEDSKIIDAPAQRGILVSTSGDSITVSGLGIGEEVDVYDLSGRLVGHGKSLDGTSTITIDTDQNILIIHTATSSIKVKR